MAAFAGQRRLAERPRNGRQNHFDLWQKRGTFKPAAWAASRTTLRVDSGLQRTVAFAATPELLLLATREDLITSALKLVSGQDVASPSNQSTGLTGPSGQPVSVVRK